jgi:hypothetical protein
MADDGDFHGHNTLLTTVIRGPCFFCLHKNWVTESPSGFTLLTPKLFDGVLLGKGHVKKVWENNDKIWVHDNDWAYLEDHPSDYMM